MTFPPINILYLIKKGIVNLEKVLYLPTRYFPAISGAELYFQRMAEILSSKYGYNVDINTSNAVDFKALRNPKGRTIQQNEKNYSQVNNLIIRRYQVNYNFSSEDKIKLIKGIDCYRSLNLPDSCLRKFLQNGPFLPEIINNFIDKDHFDFDLIHTTFYPYFNLIIGLILGKYYNKPTICTPFFHFSNPRYLDISLIEVLNKFDLLIACTNLEKRKLVNDFGLSEEKIEVVPMGVDFDKFDRFSKTTSKKFDFKTKYIGKNAKKYKMVLFCGYKNYEKGSISILKAIPYILKKIKKVCIVFIGPSTTAFNREFSKIKDLKNLTIINLTPDNLTGYFDRKKLSAFIESDVYLMPSRSDAFGISFLEAWSSGKPVIGANVGATPEVISNNIDGFLVEFDDPYDIAQKVIKILKSKRLGRKFGVNGRVKVKNNFTWEIIVEKTHKIYQNLINS